MPEPKQRHDAGAMEPADQAREASRVEGRLAAIVGSLSREADRREGARSPVERRWIEDIEQYYGKYDAETLNNLKKSKGSQLFINQTQQKTDAWAAKIGNTLFPTDDKNWGIGPTPVPSLARAAKEAVDKFLNAQRSVAQTNPNSPEQQSAVENAATAEDEGAEIKAAQDESKKRSKSMEDEIDDQLREADYQAECRKVIEDAALLGTGVLKGPVLASQRRRKWALRPTADENGNILLDGEGNAVTEYALASEHDPRPANKWVDVWSYFPDMDARDQSESESDYERHLLTDTQLKALARDPGFDADAIRELLRDGSKETAPVFMADLRAVNDGQQSSVTNRYKVWEYYGPLSAEDMTDLAVALGREDMLDEAGQVDPLTEMYVTIWFCQGRVLKFGPHPLDSGESMYSVYNLKRDKGSIFGIGIPRLMRDSQKALSAAWRMMMDNAGLSVGPQIVINQDQVEPADGSWELTSRKVWLRKNTGTPGVPAFEIYNIEGHQAELAGIIEMARQFIDDETFSQLAQGEQGSHTTPTAQGMTILTNALNIMFGRMVKNWDDGVTVPTLRRMYDWNMQFNPKDDIKGDYQVDARGSSVLLAREMQSQNLMALALSFSGHPVLGGALKDKAVPLVRRVFQSLMLSADEFVMTDEELAADAALKAKTPAPDPAILALENAINIAQLNANNKVEVAMIQRDTEMMRLAETGNMKLDELAQFYRDRDLERQNKLASKQIDVNSRERIFAAEAALTPAGDETTGGGYL